LTRFARFKKVEIRRLSCRFPENTANSLEKSLLAYTLLKLSSAELYSGGGKIHRMKSVLMKASG
jgi:hypothetical protein